MLSNRLKADLEGEREIDGVMRCLDIAFKSIDRDDATKEF